MKFNFDPFEVESPSAMNCSVRLFNGELKLNDPKQTPVEVVLAGTKERKFDCIKENAVELPENITNQILTYEWQYKVNGKSFSYCTDLLYTAGRSSEKFMSKSAAQEYLDNLGRQPTNRRGFQTERKLHRCLHLHGFCWANPFNRILLVFEVLLRETTALRRVWSQQTSSTRSIRSRPGELRRVLTS